MTLAAQVMKRIGGGFSAKRQVPSPITHHASSGAVLAAAPSSPWRVGQNVIHPTFGAGVIVGAEGRGAEARVQVNFRKGGLKWLMLEYAKLIAA